LIVLWRIEGFSSEDPVPDPLDAPTPTDMAKQTRSYFTPTLSPSRPAMFTRLAQFATPDCGIQFFMRFRMFHAPGKHPILAFANAKSKTMFWDFARFGSYARYMAELKEAQRTGKLESASGGASASGPPAVQKPSWLVVKRYYKKTPGVAAVAAASVAGDKESMVSASPDPESVSALGYSQRTLQEWSEMYDLSNPVGAIKAHRTLQIDGGFVGRQVGWSPEGEWCVVVGNGNRALIYQRWGKEKGIATPIA
jgi:polycomb protein EED